MQTPSTRDQAIERTLRAALRQTGLDPEGLCPDAETLAAWTDRTLTPEATALVESHMSGCSRCQSTLAVLGRIDEAAATPALPPWRRWQFQWLVPFAAAATVVALWVGRPDRPLQTSPERGGVGDQPAEAAGAAEPRSLSAPAPVATPEPEGRVESATAAPPPEIDGLQRTPSVRVEEQRGTESGEPREQDRLSASEAAARLTGLSASNVSAPPSSVSATVPPPGEAATLELGSRLVVSPDTAVRWRILNEQQVERSTSGGEAWEVASVTPPARLTAGSAPTDLVCWLVGPNGSVRRTTDGLLFMAVPFPEAADLVGVRAGSASAADVTTSDGRTFHTEDGGRTWSRVIP